MKIFDPVFFVILKSFTFKEIGIFENQVKYGLCKFDPFFAIIELKSFIKGVQTVREV